MAYCNGKCIRCIKMFKRCLFYYHDLLKHFPNLFLIRITISGNGLFNLSRRVFANFDACTHSSSNSNTLRTSKFQHTLNIFAKKWSFDCKAMWFICYDELFYFVMN